MQFEQISKDKRIDLPKPSVDTGMGLERITAVLQSTHDNYKIVHFKKLISASSEITHTKIDNNTIPSIHDESQFDLVNYIQIQFYYHFFSV